MNLSLAEKLLQINEAALFLFGGGTTHDLNEHVILFQRGNVYVIISHSVSMPIDP